MKRYMRFLPIILAALALAASGSNIVLRNASAQLGSTPKGGAPKVEAQLSAAAAQQISALLQEKYSRTPAQKKISMHLLNAMRVQRGEAMTSGGEVTRLNSAMSIAKSATSASKDDRGGRVLVNIKAVPTKQLMMEIENLGGEVKLTLEKAGMIRALLPLNSLEKLAGNPDVKSMRSAELEKLLHHQVTGSNVLNGMATPLGINGVRPNFNQRAMNVRAQLAAALPVARAGAKARNPLSNVGLDQLNRLMEQQPSVDPQDATTNQGSVTSKGDVAHNAALA